MKIFITTFLSIISLICASQAQDLSINKALELAKSSTVDQATINEKIQEINLVNVRRQRLPLVYIDGNLNRNLIIPVTPVPSIAFDPNAQPGEVTALKFATDWTAKAGINFSLDIFNPQSKTSILESQYQLEKNKIEKKLAEQDLEKKVVDLYAQALLAQLQLDNAIMQFDNYLSTVDIITSRYEAGRVSQIELNTCLQKRLDLQSLVDEAHGIYKQKLLQLGYYLDVTAYSHLSSDIEDVNVRSNSTVSKSMSNEIDIKVNEMKLSRIKYDILPQISLNAYYGAQYFNNDLSLFNSNYWYGNSYVNLGFKIPISESFNLRNKKNLYSQNIQSSRIQYEESLKQEILDSQSISIKIEIIDKKIAHLKEIILLAEENMKLVKYQVEEGRALVTELNTQVENLLKRQQELWQLQYNRIQELSK